ncbi:MAG: hypothetical protein ACI35U_02870 [Marinilabiliaceae bacterium]|nr:hypothetical protein [Bacteroidales bacterium]
MSTHEPNIRLPLCIRGCGGKSPNPPTSAMPSNPTDRVRTADSSVPIAEV